MSRIELLGLELILGKECVLFNSLVGSVNTDIWGVEFMISIVDSSENKDELFGFK